MKISVITAVYNCQQTISQAIESVLSQTYDNFESVVIDGGSTDGTLEKLEKFRSRLDVLISEPDRGIYDALNKGIKYSTGDVVGFLHADDIFVDADVLIQIAACFIDPAVQAVYGDLVYVKHNDLNKIVRYWQARNFNAVELSQGWMPPHPTFYVRRSVYEKLGGFDSSLRIAADYDIVLRFLAVNKIKAAYIPRAIVKMRVGGLSNRSIMNILIKSHEDYIVLRRHKVGGLKSLLWKNVRKLRQFWCKEE